MWDSSSSSWRFRWHSGFAGGSSSGVSVLKSHFNVLNSSVSMELTFSCQQSGKCCKIYAGTVIASPGDIERWKTLDRQDILQKVRIHQSDEHTIQGGEFCENPQSQEEPGNCPFVDLRSGKAQCTIHEVKPDACRRYPYDENGNVRADLVGECDGIVRS